MRTWTGSGQGSFEFNKRHAISRQAERLIASQKECALYLLPHDSDDKVGQDAEAGLSHADQHVELRITRRLVLAVVVSHAASCDERDAPELDNAAHRSCNTEPRNYRGTAYRDV